MTEGASTHRMKHNKSFEPIGGKRRPAAGSTLRSSDEDSQGPYDMAAGERSQVWFPEIVDMLRARWRRDLTWQAMVEFRDALQEELDEIRHSRRILPPVFRCPSCGSVGPAKPPVISIRAMLISVRRFGIDSFEVSEQVEREWERYRRKNKLDLVGRSSERRPAHSRGPGS
jgi:hypothetical protein